MDHSSHQLLEELLSNTSDKIYFKDLESRFISISRSQSTAFGLESSGDAIGKSDFDFFAEEHAQQAYNDEQRIIKTGEPIIGIIERETWPDGRETWASTTKMPLRDKEGKIVGTFGISRDVTELKTAEQELDRANRKLVETSRQAGMAEVAIGVLHNVGNVLNSAKLSGQLISESFKATRIPLLVKCADLLRQNEDNLEHFLTNDEKGRNLPKFLELLSKQLTEENSKAIQEIESLNDSLALIEEIVSLQQSYAMGEDAIETLPLEELIEDSLNIQGSIFDQFGINIEKAYTQLPKISVDKHRFVLVLVNLLDNAKNACLQKGDKGNLIRIEAEVDESIRIIVSDTGMGISDEHMSKLFELGFTTGTEGHGFGLHSAALAAKEMGGSLKAESPGPNQGATFRFEIPQAVV